MAVPRLALEKGDPVAVSKFPVEAGHIMVFARAIGDPNPVYVDEEYAAATEVGGIIAPPTFVQASAQWDDEFPLRPREGQPWLGSGRTPTGIDATSRAAGGDASRTRGMLHAEQHFEYHRPVRAGDVLYPTTRTGDSWEKQGRSGTLSFTELVTEFRDGAGELVVTTRAVRVMTQQGAPPAREA
jgi:acyl dehydratase